jgi:hypothetical protein
LAPLRHPFTRATQLSHTEGRPRAAKVGSANAVDRPENKA